MSFRVLKWLIGTLVLLVSMDSYSTAPFKLKYTDLFGCFRPADVVVLVDTSNSLDSVEFERLKLFLLSVIGGLRISEKGTRVGITQFGDVVSNSVFFSGNKLEVANKIIALRQIGGKSRSHLGLWNVRWQFASVGRPNVSRIVIWLSGGVNQFVPLTLSLAAQLRKDGIRVVAVAYKGGIVRDQLIRVAWTPNHAMFLPAVSSLNQKMPKFLLTLCNTITPSSELGQIREFLAKRKKERDDKLTTKAIITTTQMPSSQRSTESATTTATSTLRLSVTTEPVTAATHSRPSKSLSSMPGIAVQRQTISKSTTASPRTMSTETKLFSAKKTDSVSTHNQLPDDKITKSILMQTTTAPVSNFQHSGYTANPTSTSLEEAQMVSKSLVGAKRSKNLVLLSTIQSGGFGHTDQPVKQQTVSTDVGRNTAGIEGPIVTSNFNAIRSKHNQKNYRTTQTTVATSQIPNSKAEVSPNSGLSQSPKVITSTNPTKISMVTPVSLTTPTKPIIILMTATTSETPHASSPAYTTFEVLESKPSITTTKKPQIISSSFSAITQPVSKAKTTTIASQTLKTFSNSYPTTAERAGFQTTPTLITVNQKQKKNLSEGYVLQEYPAVKLPPQESENAKSSTTTIKQILATGIRQTVITTQTIPSTVTNLPNMTSSSGIGWTSHTGVSDSVISTILSSPPPPTAKPLVHTSGQRERETPHIQDTSDPKLFLEREKAGSKPPVINTTTYIPLQSNTTIKTEINPSVSVVRPVESPLPSKEETAKEITKLSMLQTTTSQKPQIQTLASTVKTGTIQVNLSSILNSTLSPNDTTTLMSTTKRRDLSPSTASTTTTSDLPLYSYPSKTIMHSVTTLQSNHTQSSAAEVQPTKTYDEISTPSILASTFSSIKPTSPPTPAAFMSSGTTYPLSRKSVLPARNVSSSPTKLSFETSIQTTTTVKASSVLVTTGKEMQATFTASKHIKMSTSPSALKPSTTTVPNILTNISSTPKDLKTSSVQSFSTTDGYSKPFKAQTEPSRPIIRKSTQNPTSTVPSKLYSFPKSPTETSTVSSAESMSVAQSQTQVLQTTMSGAHTPVPSNITTTYHTQSLGHLTTTTGPDNSTDLSARTRQTITPDNTTQSILQESKTIHVQSTSLVNTTPSSAGSLLRKTTAPRQKQSIHTTTDIKKVYRLVFPTRVRTSSPYVQTKPAGMKPTFPLYASRLQKTLEELQKLETMSNNDMSVSSKAGISRNPYLNIDSQREGSSLKGTNKSTLQRVLDTDHKSTTIQPLQSSIPDRGTELTKKIKTSRNIKHEFPEESSHINTYTNLSLNQNKDFSDLASTRASVSNKSKIHVPDTVAASDAIPSDTVTSTLDFFIDWFGAWGPILADDTQKKQTRKTKTSEAVDHVPSTGVCNKRPSEGKPMFYYQQSTGERWIEMPCPTGTNYNVNACACTSTLQLNLSRKLQLQNRRARGDKGMEKENDKTPKYFSQNGCDPEFYLPFSIGTVDESGRETYVNNVRSGVKVRNGLAWFRGQEKLSMPRFAGAQYGSETSISIRYMIEGPGDAMFMTLVANGDCEYNYCYGDTPFILGTSLNYTILRLIDITGNVIELEVQKSDPTVDRFRTAIVKILPGRIIVKDNKDASELRVKDTTVKVSSTGLQIGDGSELNGFTGAIDEVRLYFCFVDEAFLSKTLQPFANETVVRPDVNPSIDMRQSAAVKINSPQKKTADQSNIAGSEHQNGTSNYTVSTQNKSHTMNSQNPLSSVEPSTEDRPRFPTIPVSRNTKNSLAMNGHLENRESKEPMKLRGGLPVHNKGYITELLSEEPAVPRIDLSNVKSRLVNMTP